MTKTPLNSILRLKTCSIVAAHAKKIRINNIDLLQLRTSSRVD